MARSGYALDVGVISAWRWWTGTPTGGESVWPCSRCDGRVRMTGFPAWWGGPVHHPADDGHADT